eukprot:jgi/Botrbrau1/6401/Bobra.49_1s0018.1
MIRCTCWSVNHLRLLKECQNRCARAKATTRYERIAFVCSLAPDRAPQGNIKSLSHPYVKHCVRLRESSSYRKECGRALVPGADVLQELLGQPWSPTLRLLIVSQQHSDILGAEPELVVTATEDVIRKVTGLRSTSGLEAVAEVDLPGPLDFTQHFPSGSLRRLLILDTVQDPGNLGTLLRTATGLGWQGAFLLDGCCDPFNDKALRAAKGAAFRLPLAYGNLEELRKVQQAHGLTFLAAQPRSSAAEAAQEGVTGNVGLVLGQ